MFLGAPWPVVAWPCVSWRAALSAAAPIAKQARLGYFRVTLLGIPAPLFWPLHSFGFGTADDPSSNLASDLYS
ncbi:hypothetical protein BHE74_00032659 [Ensete ventricosum]|nr:hypothetical protein GW17_00030964 [Ensete ventricosum]RWW60340.1 hypothetical protein BHE74_00032659 [Ensete ventricosum]